MEGYMFVSLLIALQVLFVNSSRFVRTIYGELEGIHRTFPNSNFQSVAIFKGVQYASLMGKELRFMPPIPPLDSWNDVRIGINNGPVCPQRIPSLDSLRLKVPHARLDHIKRLTPFLMEQSEDCLNMNIFVPQSGNNFQQIN